MISTFDCSTSSSFTLKHPYQFPFFPKNPLQIREFRVFRRRRLKNYHHRGLCCRTFTIRSHLNPFKALFDNLVSQVASNNSLELIALALGFSSGVALYLSNIASANNSTMSDVGEWILLTSPTPFNRFVFLRCPSITFPESDLAEGVNERLVKEVRLGSGRIKATTGDDVTENYLEEKLMYQRLCINTEDGGVISLDWPSDLNLREEHGFDTTLLLVPGTPEGSMNMSIRSSVIGALRRGIFPIVMNPRGCAGSPLTTARLFTAADSDDICTAIQFINKARPWTALMAIGWGFGANMLTKYLAEVGDRTPLMAATCINNPFDLEEATKTPPHHMTIDSNFTDGLINILRSNKELFQSKAKGFDVEKALKAKSVRDFETIISRVSYGFNSLEDFYSKSSTRNVVRNVKIPVLYVQNDNGSAPLFSIPRNSIAENPYTTLLLCSYFPSSVGSGMQHILSWCQQLAIEWLTAVELGLLKGRHPLLSDVDIMINPSSGLALIQDSKTERGKVNRKLHYNRSNALSGHTSDFIKKTIDENDGSISAHQRSSIDLQSKSHLEDIRSREIEVVLQQTSSINAEIVNGDEDSSDDIEKGEVLRTAEVFMNMLDIMNPGTLKEGEKKKVLNAVDKGETLMNALQGAVPEEVRGKLTAAISEILNAQVSNLKFKDLLGNSRIPNVTSELKKKMEEKIIITPNAESATEVSLSSCQVGDANDASDIIYSSETIMNEFPGEPEPKPPYFEELQKSVNQDGCQPVDIHSDGAISSSRKDTYYSGISDHSDQFSSEMTSEHLDSSEKETDTTEKSKFIGKTGQIGSHDVAIDDSYEDQGGRIAQLDEEGNKPKKNEVKSVDSSNDQNKETLPFKMEESLSSPGSSSEGQPLEREYNDGQKDSNNVQPVLDHAMPINSGAKVNSFSVSQALDALAGIDDSTQVAVNSVFNVIENMITQLEDSENGGEDGDADSLVDNQCSENDQSSQKKECNKIDSDLRPERLCGHPDSDNLGWAIDSQHDITSRHADEEFTQNPASINGNFLVSSCSESQAGKVAFEKNVLVHKNLLDNSDNNWEVNKVPVYLNPVHNNFFLNYFAPKVPTKSLDVDTTSALLLDYIPEEGQWKFVDQQNNVNDVTSTCGVDRNNYTHSHAKVKSTDVEPLCVILDGENQPEPEEIEDNDRLKDLACFVKTIILNTLKVEIDKRLSATNEDLQCGISRDVEHVANALSLAVKNDSKHRQCLDCENYSIKSPGDKNKMNTLCGEHVIRSIVSAVQETIYLKKVLPLGVVVGSSLAALNFFFNVTTLHNGNKGECLALDKASTSVERNLGEVNGGESTKRVILDAAICREGEGAESRNLNKGTVMVGAVTAALGASALLVHQQSAYEAGQTAGKSFKSKKANFQEAEKIEETVPEKNQNIVTSLAEKAMSVASPVVPMKEDGEVDQERLVAMLADLGQKGGILRLVGKIALLWGGIRSAMSLTDRLISFLRISERPLFQRILGFVGMVLVLWSPVFLPLLPTLVHSWTTNTASTIACLACNLGLYTAFMILIMMWGKRIRGYENPFEKYGLDLTSSRKIYNFSMAFFGGVVLVFGIQFVNKVLGYASLSWPSISSSLNVISWFKVYGKILLLAGQGIISATMVAAVEELLFRSWLTEEIASDLGYYPAVMISGLAFSISQRSLQAIPGLWMLSLGLARARERSEGSLSIPIGLRAGILASSIFLEKGGFISFKAKYPPVWRWRIMGTDTVLQPLSGVVGFAFALLVVLILYPRNPMEKRGNNFKRAIRE